MAIDTREMREQRHKMIVSAREILDKADEEKRALSEEEKVNEKKALEDAEGLRTKIVDAEHRNDLERLEAETKLSQDFQKPSDDGENAQGHDNGEKRAFARQWETPEYRSAWVRAMTADTRRISAEEQRALSAGTSTEGGYLYAPETFVAELIKNVTDTTIMRQPGMARVFPPVTGSDSFGFPVLDNRMAAAAWTSELGTPDTDSTLSFGKRELRPNPLTKEILVSKVLLRKTPLAEQVVREELARVISEAMENAYMTGTGAQQPLGIFTASSNGISTDRDVSTNNTSTTPTFKGLKAAKYELKQAYWGKAAWIFHRDVMELIALLMDGNGRFLLQDSVVQGEPDRILGFPVHLSEFAPNTISASAYVGILGDFQNYWIVDSIDFEVQRLEELYARSNKDCFLTRMMTDGAPVREEAFVRVKLGT